MALYEYIYLLTYLLIVMISEMCYFMFVCKTGLENGEQLSCESSSEKPGDRKICESWFTLLHHCIVLSEIE